MRAEQTALNRGGMGTYGLERGAPVTPCFKDMKKGSLQHAVLKVTLCEEFSDQILREEISKEK